MHSRPSDLENLTLRLFSKLAISHLDESGFYFSRHISSIFSNDRFWEANFCSIHYQNGRLEEFGRKASAIRPFRAGFGFLYAEWFMVKGFGSCNRRRSIARPTDQRV